MRDQAGVFLVVVMMVATGAATAEQECVARGPYLGATPTDGVSVFAPGVASTQYHDDWPPVFSEDGREVVLRIPGFVGDERRGTL